MKKISIVLGIFAIVALSSCRKSRICECVTYINEEEQPKIDNTYNLENMTKQVAIDECNDWDSTEVTVDGTLISTNCELN